jgi:xanthine dehydrogenase accessory factor
MSKNFYWQLYQILNQSAVVVATVVRTRGSTPREVGAKMLITASGQTIDTIGGGAGEAKVCQQAQAVLQTGEKQVVGIDLSGDLSSACHRPTEGVCGGWMQVWLERWQGQAAIALVQQILAQLQTQQPGVLITPLSATQSPYLVPHLPTDLVAPDLHRLADGQTLGLREPLSTPTLLIVGAGHVGVALAQIAHWLGFHLIVQDDRPEFACAERFPLGTVIWSRAIETIAPSEWPQPSQLSIALVTRGYQYDLAAMLDLLKRPFPCYLGMIGSRKRVQVVLQALQQQAPSAWLSQIRAPIGLDIGALTPEEIAVSICAELIQVRRGGTGLPLSVDHRAATSGDRASAAFGSSSIAQSLQASVLNQSNLIPDHIQQQITQQQT